VEGADCVLVLQDFGPGLPSHVAAEQLFEPFTRGVTESSVSGMGLGLTLAQRIVEAHGGSLHAESTLATQGTVFSLRLPVPEQPPVDE
jgi:two-component system sensor histidine kinase KdpD